jgi:phosphonate transport system substrate-binding protein
LLIVLCLVAGGAAQFKAGSDAATGAGAPPLRMAVSEKVVLGVNLADAGAALAIWSQELLPTANLKLAPDQNWVKPSGQLLAAIRGGTVDMFCLTVQEYRRVAQYVDTNRIITDDHGGDEFLLVVREGSGVVNLAGLRGRSVILQESPNTSVAEPWLAVSLWREGLESPNRFLSRMTKQTKLSQVVLPVFFGQADACLVTRRGLDTMAELNPQLSRKLKVLLASPKMVNAFFAWRKDYPAELKQPIFDKVLNLRSSRTAEQVLTLFQSPGYTIQDSGCLREANSVLDAYERRLEPVAGGKK